MAQHNATSGERPTYDEVYRDMFDQAPPEEVERGWSDAGIVQPARGFIGGFDLTMQVQVGCPAGCRFCYVASAGRLAPKSVRGEGGRTWGYAVRDKRDVGGKLERLLARGKLADASVYWSGVTDPYAAPADVTRAVWERLLAAKPSQRPRRVVVQTRFGADRDAALMRAYAEQTAPSDGGPPVLVSLSIGTDDDGLIRAWERATPPFARRMKAVRRLREAGLWVIVTFSPLGPWSDLEGMVRQLDAWGVAYVTCLPFKRKVRSASTPAAFGRHLEAYYGELLDPAWQAAQTDVMRGVLGAPRVLTGQAGFASLTQPHAVVAAAARGVCWTPS